MEWLKKHSWIKQAFLYGVVACCTAVLVSLCFNDGVDYDEAFSFSIVHNSPDIVGVADGLLESPFSDVIPLWYMALKLWTMIFGESFPVCKLFTVLGSVCTMMLGPTIVRRNWGYKAAFLYIIPAGLAPGLMHVGVNIRTYSWTVFIVTACALAAYSIVRNPGRFYLWILLFLTTVTGLLCHHFTAFSYFCIYSYLFVALIRRDRKSIWKIFVCGVTALIPFGIWLYISDFFRMSDAGGVQLGLDGVDLYHFWSFVFGISVDWSYELGRIIFVLVVVSFIVLRKRFQRNDVEFVLLGLFTFFISYILSVIMGSASQHFVATRHTMHSQALLWMGLAIILSRMNTSVYVSAFWYLLMLCGFEYASNYRLEYNSVPYIEETKAFIADNIQADDIVIFNAQDKMFSLVYECYMPDVEYIYFREMTDESLQSLSGKKVWFLQCMPGFFTEEQQKQYGITYENMGHYGFQIIENCTEFDILQVDIAGEE